MSDADVARAVTRVEELVAGILAGPYDEQYPALLGTLYGHVDQPDAEVAAVLRAMKRLHDEHRDARERPTLAEAFVEHVAAFVEAVAGITDEEVETALTRILATLPTSPDCATPGKCGACTGDAWDVATDQMVPCGHACHAAGSAS